MRYLIVYSVVGVCLAFGAMARTDEERQYLGETTGTAVETVPLGPQAVPMDSLSRTIKQALPRKPGIHSKRKYAVKQRLVLRNERHVHYVATVWHETSFNLNLLTIHRVDPDGSVMFKGELEADHLTIVAPSGHDAFADGSAALFVDEGSGGSGYDGYFQHIFRLGERVEEINLPFRTVWADVIEGRLIAMSSDDRWASYFFGCGQCGPHIPVVSVWEKDRFVPACRRYSGFIETRLRDFRAEVDQRTKAEESGERVADAFLNVALLHLQAGRGPLGRQWLDHLEEGIKNGVGIGVLNESRLQRFREDFRSIAAEAAASPEECPLSASGSPKGSHPGFDDRNNHFRYSNRR